MLTIKVNKNLNTALKKLKQKAKKTKLLKNINNRKHYVKKSKRMRDREIKRLYKIKYNNGE